MSHYSKPSPYHEMATVFVYSAGMVSVSDVAAHLQIGEPTTIRIISELLMDKSIQFVGRARDAGRTDINTESKLYAKPGTPMLPRVEIYKRDQSQGRKPKNAAGSGFTPVGRYQPPEFRELRRDPWEHMNMAMVGPR